MFQKRDQILGGLDLSSSDLDKIRDDLKKDLEKRIEDIQKGKLPDLAGIPLPFDMDSVDI